MKRRSPDLPTQVLRYFPTPTASDYGSNQSRPGERTRPSLFRLVLGSLNTTGSSLGLYRLNPKWVAQLQGLPYDWLDLG